MIEVLHPVSQKPMVGWPLGKGAEMQEADLYDSTDGTWRNYPYPGSRPAILNVIVVRSEDLSEAAQQLLTYLNEDDTWYSCIARHLDRCYVFPCINFVWDTRIAWPQVDNSTVDELIDYGYLGLRSECDPNVYSVNAQGGIVANRLAEIASQSQ